MKVPVMFSATLSLRQNLLVQIGQSFDTDFLKAVKFVVKSIKTNNTLFFAGNGGSAAEAQHMSAEYLATLDHRNFRPGIKALALTVDTSFITAWTNDFGYEDVYLRQLRTLATKGDVFFAYSTSGQSQNIIRAVEYAKKNDIYTIGFTGNDGGLLGSLCDTSFIVPSKSTSLIQEVHTMLGHEICGAVEKVIELNV
jgi:D-sedoheptulose 7-phosphate isomerase